MDHAPRPDTSTASATHVVDVLVPVALNHAYSYRVPRGMELKPGDVVCVPLGPREVVAVVWAENAKPDPRLHNRLKDVGEKLDVPPLKEELRSLISRASSARPSMPCARWRRTAAFTSRCSMASPVRARPKSISRRSPKSSGAASRR